MAPATPSTDVGHALALAIIDSSQAPLLLLDEDLCVVAASESFAKHFAISMADVEGRSIFAIGKGEWNLPRLHSLLTAIGSGDARIDAYELEMPVAGQPSRCLLLNAQRLDFTAGMALRLLVTVVDVTATKAAEALKNDLIREKDILLRELQHRVANSLQIIASVLLQNARKSQSDETRTHLTDAHNRVMSVAAVQQHLSASHLGDVILRPYFTQLCLSLGASMIVDHDQLRIVVTGDGSVTSAEISVSLGLIVTELVINSLKHAFPDDRKGVVTVDYRSSFDGWTLSVTDDGVGMPTGTVPAKAGLGTAIVQALASQLSARIDVKATMPGTMVSAIYKRPAPGVVAVPTPVAV